MKPPAQLYWTTRRGARGLGLALAAAVVAGTPSQAWAQARGVLERNLPPAISGGGGLQQQEAPAITGNDTPLGVDVSGIRLIGQESRPIVRAPGGITFSGVEGIAQERLASAVRPFLGKPLSARLVAEVQAAVAVAYRAAGRPFVSVTAPPQDISNGVLQIQVVPFRHGAVSVSGPAGAPVDAQDRAMAAKIRANPGSFIEATHISEDLDWLNRFPYRQINGVFEPGSQPGSSDLTLEVTRQKPWQVFAGWSNTGTQQTDYNRYFVGFGLGLESLNDTTVSYQFTGSGNVFTDPASVDLQGSNWPHYVSHAGRLVIPTLPRQAVEISPSFVATSQQSLGNVLTFQNTTFELPVLYRSALSNIAITFAGWGEVYGGVAPKWTGRNTLFQSVEVASGTAGVFDVILGWANQLQDVGTTAVDVRLVANPGGVVGGNDSATWSRYTNGRVTDAQYVYGFGMLEQSTPLAALATWLTGFSAHHTLYAQVAGQALPDTEQLSIGGYYAARGYTLSDGSVDTGFVLRNDLRLPAFSVLARTASDGASLNGVRDSASPFLFVDVAYGYNFGLAGPFAPDPNTLLIGAGAGLDYAVARNLQAGVVAGVALTDGPVTTSGDVTIQGRIVVTY